jgi:hypothetical protein
VGPWIIKPLPYYRQGHRIYFLHGGSCGADSLTPNNWVIIRVMVDRADLKVKVGYEPWMVEEMVFFTFSKFYLWQK